MARVVIFRKIKKPSLRTPCSRSGRFLFGLILVAAISVPGAVRSESAGFKNIRGNAWNDTYGKISFNCMDDGDTGHFPYTFTFRFFTAPCDPNTHGVNIDTNYNFSGEAWNSTLGLITFNATTSPPGGYAAFNSHCPHTCDLSNDCWACYNEDDEKIYGWARVLNTGAWIQLNSSFSPQSSINNYISASPGYFHGIASSSFGQIKFNCNDDSSCLTNDFLVWRWPIELRKLSAPNWSFSEACSNGARQAVFKWWINSGSQSAYQLIVSNDNNTSSPVYDSGKTAASAKQFICSESNGCSLSYDKHYYFWLRLWDESYTATPTDWRQFDTNNGDTLTDNSSGNSSSPNPNLTFTTYKHEFPMPYFSWNPADVIVGSSTYFTGASQYYTTTYPNYDPQACSSGNCTHLWTTTDTGALISSTTAATTTMAFTKATNTRVYLKTTDLDNYYCSTSTLLNVNFLLPNWKEIKATSTGQ